MNIQHHEQQHVRRYQTKQQPQSKPENRLIRVVFHADLRCSHDGLVKLGKQLDLDLTNLNVGEFVAFINSKRTMIKLYAAGDCIAHYRAPAGHVINLDVLALIPSFFNGNSLQYDDALREVISRNMK